MRWKQPYGTCGATGRSTQTAWGTWGARAIPKQCGKELVQRKGRTKAGLPRQQQTTLWLRVLVDLCFTLTALPGLGSSLQFPQPLQLSHQSLQLRVSQQAASPVPEMELQAGAVPEGQPRGTPPRSSQRRGVDPQPGFSSLESGRKAELGAEGASGPGSDTSQIREVCGLEPKHRMCSAEEGLGEGACCVRHS